MKTRGKSPVAFIIPSESIQDQSVERLQQALSGLGIQPFKWGNTSKKNLQEMMKYLKNVLNAAHLDRERLILAGFREGADLIARSYYDFFSIQSPQAAILFSPTVQSLFLNNLTCPYLMIHGARDPVFRQGALSRFEEAVHHHQMRYGDMTAHLVFPDLNQDVGNFDPYVEEKVVHWLKGIERNWQLQGPQVA